MITRDQALTLDHRHELHYGPCVMHVGPRGGKELKQERWRVNGRVKTWKTRPNDFQVPIKHGMKTCAYLDQDNAANFHLSTECIPKEVTR